MTNQGCILIIDCYNLTFILLYLQSTEVYGLVSKDLEEVTTSTTSYANSMVRSSSMTIKKTFEVSL